MHSSAPRGTASPVIRQLRRLIGVTVVFFAATLIGLLLATNRNNFQLSQNQEFHLPTMDLARRVSTKLTEQLQALQQTNATILDRENIRITFQLIGEDVQSIVSLQQIFQESELTSVVERLAAQFAIAVAQVPVGVSDPSADFEFAVASLLISADQIRRLHFQAMENDDLTFAATHRAELIGSATIILLMLVIGTPLTRHLYTGVQNAVLKQQASEWRANVIASRVAAARDLRDLTLGGAELSEILDRTIIYLAEGLESPVVAIIDARYEHKLLAGRGLPDELIGSPIVPLGDDSCWTFMADAGAVVEIADLAKETRFLPPTALVENGAVGGMGLAWPADGSPTFCIGVFDRGHRHFTHDEIEYVAEIAHVLEQIFYRFDNVELQQGQEAILSTAQTMAKIGAYSLNIQTREVTQTKELNKLLGRTIRTMEDAMELTHPDDAERVTQHLQRTFSTGEDFNLEFRLMMPDGSVKPVRSWGRVINDRSGAPLLLVGAHQDITDQKEAEKALREKNDQLERSNAELERFAYVASHDLQEPLRMVSSYVELLGERYQGQLDDTAHEFITYAVAGVRRMQALIRDLLAYSKVGSNRGNFAPVHLDNIVDEVLHNLEVQIVETGCSITRAPLPSINGNASQLAQMFQNLVSNAVKFHTDEDPSVHISAVRNGSRWIISVEDNGIGIDPEFHSQVFDIFQRLHNFDDYPGTGVGLALVRTIAHNHNGTVELDSAPNKGSTFRITLPASQDNQ